MTTTETFTAADARHDFARALQKLVWLAGENATGIVRVLDKDTHEPYGERFEVTTRFGTWVVSVEDRP